MSLKVFDEYLSIGGNRQTAASAWSQFSGALAFGADQNVAIWYPINDDRSGIRYLLNGHQAKVTSLSFIKLKNSPEQEYLITGAADGQILLWSSSPEGWQISATIAAHTGAVNAIACLDDSSIFVSGGADTTLKLWTVESEHLKLIAVTTPRPRFIPLTLVLGAFPSVGPNQGCFLAAGGTRNEIQVYAITGIVADPVVELQATLKGHEGWIRALALKHNEAGDLLLASASADKYVRLWRFSSGEKSAEPLSMQKPVEVGNQQSLKAKTETIFIDDHKLFITFEALLLGHEDWVYSARFSPRKDSDQLLTASADGTLAMWEPDSASGIWISTSRLGEISGQKGATTATGSSGGFWNALWSPDGYTVTCLGRTGSWRIWTYNSSTEYWVQKSGISGHTSSVNSLAWPKLGQYLLSTSSDQTTRLHAEWRRGEKRSWHEFSRPQIHGYDLNCITPTSDHQFVSGADEKLLRVFNEPRDVAEMLSSLCSIQSPDQENLPEMAAIPVLGLSNKSMGEEDDSFTETGGKRDQDYIAASVLETSLAHLQSPPNEDVLARHTLWPEHEKLYGHGYEISECAVSDDYLATVCKASSTDHAVIRIYHVKTWSEIKPPLQAHSLTVTRLAWSHSPENWLLSVGRDRQWAVFARADGAEGFKLLQSNGKAHSRMILDATWSPVGGKQFFATAGRDKIIKVWSNKHDSNDAPDRSPDFVETETIKRSAAVTAIDFTCNYEEDFAILAAGEETGRISIHLFRILHNEVELVMSVELPLEKCPSKTVNRLSWRSHSVQFEGDSVGTQLAIAAADGSVRILGIDVQGLCSASFARKT